MITPITVEDDLEDIVCHKLPSRLTITRHPLFLLSPIIATLNYFSIPQVILLLLCIVNAIFWPIQCITLVFYVIDFGVVRCS